MHEKNIQNIINIAMYFLTCPVIIQQWEMDLIETMTRECMASLVFLSCYPYKGILRFIMRTFASIDPIFTRVIKDIIYKEKQEKASLIQIQHSFITVFSFILPLQNLDGDLSNEMLLCINYL